MKMKKPAKCVTPKRDRYNYRLTVHDMRSLIALVNEANDILAYYINMPENRSGELTTVQTDMLEELSSQVEELKTTIDEVVWL